MRIGAYSGWAGLAQAALEAAPLLGDESLRAPALGLLAQITAGEVPLEALDVLAGCAGAIPPSSSSSAGSAGRTTWSTPPYAWATG